MLFGLKTVGISYIIRDDESPTGSNLQNLFKVYIRL